jgi:hypothetical protein
MRRFDPDPRLHNFNNFHPQPMKSRKSAGQIGEGYFSSRSDQRR